MNSLVEINKLNSIDQQNNHFFILKPKFKSHFDIQTNLTEVKNMKLELEY